MSACQHLGLTKSGPKEAPWHCPDCSQDFKSDLFDRFYTGDSIAKRMVEWACANGTHGSILEPSAGYGALVRHMPAGSEVHAVDLVRENAAAVKALRPKATVYVGDFLTQRLRGLCALAIMNPPYGNGADGRHVAHALRCADRVVALVRSNFLSGVDRYQTVWSQARLTRHVVLSRRPAFTGPAHEGHSARHDYCIVELVRRDKAREKGETDDVKVEFWA
jgi:predicted RNA methylase